MRSAPKPVDDSSGMDTPAVATVDTSTSDTVVVEAPKDPPPAREKTAVAEAPAPRSAEPPPTNPRPAVGIPLATSGRANVPAAPVEARYAVTWANVREARSTNAAVVRVLNPGELVRVRDYQGGWWQAMLDGKPIGYVGNSVLQRQPLGDRNDREPSTDG